MSQALEAASLHLEGKGWQVIEEFMSLLSLPNVTRHSEQLSANAHRIASVFASRGATMEVLDLEGAAPVVIGELRCQEPLGTLGVYVHYDGQPVDPEKWTTPPFEPVLATASWHAGGERVTAREGPIDGRWRLYARSASDDKTPFAAILGAVDALDAADLERRVDLVFLFEGEEESGSPNLGTYMEMLSDRLRADAWLLCDGPVHQSRRPQVAFGARGYCGFDLTVYGPERELHSGHYGNHVPNPALDLARLLSSCKNDEGSVTIDGFFADTQAVSDADREVMNALPEVDLETELGFAAPESEQSYPDRLMIPSFNVRGISAAAVGEAARNVIPSEATASVDIRLAAGDDPTRMLDRVESHLVDQGYIVLDRQPTAEERRSHRHLCRMIRDVGYRAVRIPIDSSLASVLLDVVRAAGEEEPVALPTFGGSVPLYLFEDVLDAPVVVLPIANHDNNQHAPDENVRIANLWYGVRVWSMLLTTDLAEVG